MKLTEPLGHRTGNSCLDSVPDPLIHWDHFYFSAMREADASNYQIITSNDVIIRVACQVALKYKNCGDLNYFGDDRGSQMYSETFTQTKCAKVARVGLCLG